MSNIISKGVHTILVVIGFLAVTAVFGATGASAHLVEGAADATGGVAGVSSKLEHAYHPKYDSVVRNTVAARINNWMSGRFVGTICATEVAGGVNYHRGCFRAEMEPAWSTTGNWSTGDFGVTTFFGGGVRYTYRLDGTTTWREVPQFAHAL